MRERLITVLILLPLVLAALLFVSGEVLTLLLAIVLTYCAWEWSQFVAPASRMGRIVFTVLVADLMVALFAFTGFELRWPYLMEVAVVGWVLTVIWVARYPTPMPAFVALVVGAAILVVAWAALSLLALAGWQWLLFLLVLVWAADVGAYFVGRAIGVRKLAPRVSPGKTWAGVAGGASLSVVVAGFGAWWFALPPVSFMSLCLAAALISVLGDLTVSMFKRSSGMKDSGRLLPGHGGMLDRVDSLLAAAPVLVAGLIHLGVIQ